MKEMRKYVDSRAYAKINLSLEVLGKRPDGYHEIVSVVHELDLYDELRFEQAPKISLRCSDDSLRGEDNLVVRAARLLREHAQHSAGCSITLMKRIPVGAGLGGGSSDAAATLMALNELWAIRLPLDELSTLAGTLGADVPFFLHGHTALISGCGEQVEEILTRGRSWFVLVNPRFHVGTAEVYGAVRHEDHSDGTTTRQLAQSVRRTGVIEVGVNGLQHSLFRTYPSAYEVFRLVRERAPGRTFVTGSGPTIVVLCEDQGQADHLVRAVNGRGWWACVSRSAERGS